MPGTCGEGDSKRVVEPVLVADVTGGGAELPGSYYVWGALRPEVTPT